MPSLVGVNFARGSSVTDWAAVAAATAVAVWVGVPPAAAVASPMPPSADALGVAGVACRSVCGARPNWAMMPLARAGSGLVAAGSPARLISRSTFCRSSRLPSCAAWRAACPAACVPSAGAKGTPAACAALGSVGAAPGSETAAVAACGFKPPGNGTALAATSCASRLAVNAAPSCAIRLAVTAASSCASRLAANNVAAPVAPSRGPDGTGAGVWPRWRGSAADGGLRGAIR